MARTKNPPTTPTTRRRARQIIQDEESSESPDEELTDDGEDEVEEEEDDDDGEEEMEEEDEVSGEASDATTHDTTSPLKIKLKLPMAATASTPSSTATPEPISVPSRKRAAAARSRRRIQDMDIDSSEEEEDSESIPSVSTSKRPMTSRQAALASGADPSHVSLDIDAPSVGKSRKKNLTATELALRREETARKRKNLSEKKLEDEKAETINRLLKKQSRPRGGKRGPAPAVEPQDEDEDVEMAVEDIVSPPVPEPVMYRWISTTRQDGDNKKMELIFSVPPRLVTSPSTPQVPLDLNQQWLYCDILGCTAVRKYRYVKDPTYGACGLVHLKMLENDRSVRYRDGTKEHVDLKKALEVERRGSVAAN